MLETIIVYNLEKRYNMLINKYSNKISNSLLPIELINPYPISSNREKWDNINTNVKVLIIERAKKFENIELKPLKATLLLDSISTGNVEKCNMLFNEKTDALIALTLAECVENSDKYTEKILNVAWSLFDMAIWYLPKISGLRKDNNSRICDATQQILDLASTKIGYILTYSYFLLKEKFDKIDVNIGVRFKFEIERRIINPFINGDRFYITNNEKQNNIEKLTCLRNILLPVLIFSEDYETRHDAVKKSMQIADTIITSLLKENDKATNSSIMLYCSLLKYLDLMYMASGSVFDIFDERFISRMEEQIKSSSFNKINNCNVSLLQFADYTGNKNLISFIFNFYSSADYINMLKTNISIEESLYIIFNYDLIMSGFYI